MKAVATFLGIFLGLMPGFMQSQCDPYTGVVYSARLANYKMNIELDHERKMIQGSEVLSWYNPSPDTITELRFYMYINAFKDFESTFMRGTDGQIFGRDLRAWPKDHLGFIEIHQVSDHHGNDLTDQQKYIQPDDGNEKDQSVLSIDLMDPILPGDSIILDIQFQARLPRIIVRTGWAPKNYFALLHWFPQIGVYEQDAHEVWGWNCHQFFRSTEFYAEFGNYDVTIHLDDQFVVGATGCEMSRTTDENGRQSIRFYAEDVIDFALIAYPDFLEFEDHWEHVHMQMLISSEHALLAPRFVGAVKQVLDYMTDLVGPFPYPSITIVDPPIQGLNSGFMEYPMLITVGSFYRFPRQIRSIESLAMHEFLHQYFMGIVATNEKEEPWLDEGFVTYFEDRILDDLYGDKCSYIDFLGYRMGNTEFSRQEYVSLHDPNEFPIASAGWNIRDARKGIIYGKTGIVLKTLENIIGRNTMDEIMRTYYQRFKFKHPRGKDFNQIVSEIVSKHHGTHFAEDLKWIFEEIIYTATSIDFRVNTVEKHHFEVQRHGDLKIPVDIKVCFQDGSYELLQWDKDQVLMQYEFSDRIIQSVHIDPEHKILIDLNVNNNSYTRKPSKVTLWKYAMKALFWTQNTFQTTTMMF